MAGIGWGDLLPGGGASLAAALLCTLAAGILRGFTGFGFALAAVPLLGFFLPPTRAVALAVGLQLCAGLVDFPDARRACHWPSLARLVPTSAAGSALGVAALAVAPPTAARLAIALICAGGTLLLARGLKLARMPGTAATAGVGLAAGLFNGLAAMPGPPVVAYYLAAPLPSAQVRASLLVFFLATSVAGAASLWAAGFADPATLAVVALGIPPMIVGSRLGHALFRRAAGRAHRPVSIAILALVAAVSGLDALRRLL